MRKVAALLMVCILLSVFTSKVVYAETKNDYKKMLDSMVEYKDDNYAIKNGIQFYDSPNTVFNKLYGSNITSISLDYFSKIEDIFQGLFSIKEQGTEKWWWNEQDGNVSGYSCDYWFGFDEQEQLLEVMYFFNTQKSLFGLFNYYDYGTDINDYIISDSTNNVYAALYSGLERKYGKPLSIEEEKRLNSVTLSEQLTKEFAKISADYSSVYGERESFDNQAHKEWLIKISDDSDYYVVIILDNSAFHLSGYESLTLDYKMFTLDDYYSSIQEEQNNQIRIDSDL